MALLDLADYLDLPERLENAERSVPVEQAELLAHPENVALQVEEVFPERMDLPDLKVCFGSFFSSMHMLNWFSHMQVRLVIVDPLDLMGLRVKSEILAGQALLVCKVFVAYPAELDRLASPVVLVNAVYPALTAKTANKDLKASKVYLGLLVFQENAVHQ